MTQNSNLKKRVRAYMAEHDVKYTEALRIIEELDATAKQVEAASQ